MTPLIHYPLPEWLPLAFLVLIPLPFVLILRLIWLASKRTLYPGSFGWILVFFVVYVAYVVVAGLAGWFDAVSFPPRVLLFTTFPYAFLVFGLILPAKPTQAILEVTRPEEWIRLHIFRVIGGFFVLLALYDALPKAFAWIAGTGDVVTAVSGLVVARAWKEGKPYARKLAICWNAFGSADILFTAIGANVLTLWSIRTGSMGVDALAHFPFCLIPAFAPPTILALHWVIYKKIRASK